MNLQTVVENWLKDHGYDGLYHPDMGCGCRLGELLPCQDPSPECLVGYSVPPPGDSDADFWISPTKAEGSGR